MHNIEVATLHLQHETPTCPAEDTEVFDIMMIEEKEVNGIGNIIPASFTGSYHRLMKITQIIRQNIIKKN